MFKDKFVLAIIIATILVLVGGVIFARKMGSSPDSSGSVPVSQENQKLLEVVSDDYVKGNKEASVTIVEYLDFECEACGAYYPLIKQLAEEFKADVRFVVRFFPLPGHKNGLPSALAVEAAARQGKYWEMHNILFENQKSWGEKQSADPKIFEEYAKQIGLNLERFKNDVSSKEIKDRVERDRSSGQRLGVSGTPSFFLNGEKIPNPKTPEDFKTFIQAAILKAPKLSGQGNVRELTMTAKKFEFSPASITISEGDKVKLTIDNLDVPHGFAIDELGIKQDLPVGTTTVEFTASKKGTFRFYCSLFCGSGHKEMEGQLVVE